ncbi:CpaD family pilus assembly lipoprotein [Bradyrhizobium sp. UFLA05-153]
MTLRTVCLLISMTANVGGCTSSAPTYVEPTAQAILVRPQTSVLLLKSFRGIERQHLRDFIARASRGRLDAVRLNIIGSPRLIAQVASQARAMGVDAYNIRLNGPRIVKHEGFAVQVEAIVYEARPPDCPPVTIAGPSVNDNSFDETLGCSIRNNLAVTVNDPHDLLDNEAVAASNGDRAALPVASYRTFTTGDNSSRERGADSRVSSQAPSTGTTDVHPSQ